MYAAKSGGRRTYRFFEPAMGASANARLTMEQDLRQALTRGGFELHYQPLVDLIGGEVTGCEALLRWHHPERGMVSPAEFVPVAEDAGLIDDRTRAEAQAKITRSVPVFTLGRRGL